MDRLEQLWLQWSVPVLPKGLPDFQRNLLTTLAIAVVVGLVAGQRLGLSGRLRAVIWFICLLAPLAYTLTATGRVSPMACDMDWRPWLSPWALTQPDTRANLVLLMPAGAASVLLPPGARRLAALGAALAMPVVIELTQLFVGRLGRGCQLGDIVNNQVSVIIGFWMASGLLVLWHSIALTRGAANSSGAGPLSP